MSPFNQRDRNTNLARGSASGVICSVANLVIGFIYRTFFVYVLSAAYLGINGLFTNVLAVLSLSELGITTAILYRLYEPIARNDVKKVGRLMSFMKRVYLVIAGVILVLGCALIPFLDSLIKDASAVPPDVNLTVVYLLFLLQSASSYLFAYRLTILNADQRQDTYSYVQLIMSTVRYVVQVVILLVFRDYTLSLLASVIATFLLNIAFSAWVTGQYKEVFTIKEAISKHERKEVYSDTTATLCHQIGATVINSTDGIVLSAFVGIVSAGIYSNYALIMNGIKSLISKMFLNMTSVFGNAHINLSLDEGYAYYSKLNFVNLCVSGFVSTCLFLLTNDFVTIWLGGDYLLDDFTVAVLSLQFFVFTSRQVTNAYTTGCGLFVKDKLRSIIEAALNIAFSIPLAMRFGVAGVFLGTLLSDLVTSFWRMPYILFKYEFKKPVFEYWRTYCKYLLFVVLFAGLALVVKSAVVIEVSFFVWLLEAVVIFALYSLLLWLVYRKDANFAYIRGAVLKLLAKR